MHLRKGSPAAKAHMARLRKLADAARARNKRGRRKNPLSKGERATIGLHMTAYDAEAVRLSKEGKHSRAAHFAGRASEDSDILALAAAKKLNINRRGNPLNAIEADEMLDGALSDIRHAKRLRGPDGRAMRAHVYGKASMRGHSVAIYAADKAQRKQGSKIFNVSRRMGQRTSRQDVEYHRKLRRGDRGKNPEKWASLGKYGKKEAASLCAFLTKRHFPCRIHGGAVFVPKDYWYRALDVQEVWARNPAPCLVLGNPRGKAKRKRNASMLVLGNKGRTKNPSGMIHGVPAAMWRSPKFQAALSMFRRRHGCMPASIRKIRVPDGYPDFLVSYGRTPEVKYDAPPGSNKGKRIHKFGKRGSKKSWPTLATSPERGHKFLVFVDGKFKAKTDWLYD